MIQYYIQWLLHAELIVLETSMEPFPFECWAANWGGILCEQPSGVHRSDHGARSHIWLRLFWKFWLIFVPGNGNQKRVACNARGVLLTKKGVHHTFSFSAGSEVLQGPYISLPLRFLDFQTLQLSTPRFTMFQVITGDSWSASQRMTWAISHGKTEIMIEIGCDT